MIFNLCDNAGSQSIANLIDDTRNCECSDPKDRIYGVLGMFTGGDRRLEIIPDHQKSIDQVYRDFFLSFLNTFEYGNLLLLSWCEIRDHRSTMPSCVPDLSQKRISRPFHDSVASGSSAAEVEYTGKGSLKVLGVKVATIMNAHQTQMHGRTQSDVVAEIRQYGRLVLNRNGGELLENYCRTMGGDHFRDRYDPPSSAYPSLNESKEVLRRFLGPQEDVDPLESLDVASTSYLQSVFHAMENRSFISTEAGHIGLAPLLAKAGDEVVVIPSCPSPMALRPTTDGKYKVVGECFILGFMNGEALLGPFPEGYESISKLFGDDGDWYIAYRDRRTDQSQWIDPRFNLFRSEMQENGKRKIFIRGSESNTESVINEYGVRMRTSELPGADEVIVMGVDLKPFELI
jgi:hypothetical protein